MRFLILISILVLAIVTPARAEFRQIEVTFEGTGCISCAESLPGRLERVRGVKEVRLDLDRSTVAIKLEAGNKVRLAPLLARITQDGTKVRRVEASSRGTIERQGEGFRFQPAGLSEVYRLKTAGSAPPLNPRDGALYEVRGVVTDFEPGSEAMLEAASVQAVPAESR
jgi:copper chaperone CopZ